MNIYNILSVVMDVILTGLMLMVALDILRWTFTGEYNPKSDDIAAGMMNTLVDIPIRIIYAILNLVLKIVESLIKMVFSILGLTSVAEKVDFGTIEYKPS